jgi:hypothetical protein
MVCQHAVPAVQYVHLHGWCFKCMWAGVWLSNLYSKLVQTVGSCLCSAHPCTAQRTYEFVGGGSIDRGCRTAGHACSWF